MLAAIAAYLLIFNQERIYINLPGIGEFKVIAALAFIICFAIGATAVTFYFGTDVLRKSWEIKRLTKRVKHLEGKLEAYGNPTAITESKRRSWFGSKEPALEQTTPVSLQDRDLL